VGSDRKTLSGEQAAACRQHEWRHAGVQRAIVGKINGDRLAGLRAAVPRERTSEARKAQHKTQEQGRKGTRRAHETLTIEAKKSGGGSHVGFMTAAGAAAFCPIGDERSMTAGVAISQSGLRGGWFLSFR